MTASHMSARSDPGRLNPSFTTSTLSGTPSSSVSNYQQQYLPVPSTSKVIHGIESEIVIDEIHDERQNDINELLNERSRAKGDQRLNDRNNFPSSKWRWVNLASVFLALASSASCMTTFSSVSRQVAEGYGTSIVTVNTSTICYFASYILSNFPSTYLIEAGQTQGYGLMISVSMPNIS